MFDIGVILLLRVVLLMKNIANCQNELSANGVNSPGSDSNSGSHPSNGQVEQRGGDFAGFWTSLLGGEGCGGCNRCGNCTGSCSRCGNGGGTVNNVVNKNIIINNVNYYPAPVTADPVTSTTSSTTTSMPSCQVFINGGPYALSVCGQELFYATSVYGCSFSRISFQLMNLPCAYVQSDGALAFYYISFGCSVGQVDYGTLTATDTWTGLQLASATIMVDTTNLQNCITTVTPTPTCTVSYPHGQYSLPYQCNMVILEPASTPGCALYQVSYQLTNMPCAQVLNDGSVVVSLSNYGNGCDVGPSIIYYGTLTATDLYTGTLLGTWNIQMDTSSLSHCIGTTTTTTTTESTPPQPICNVTAFGYQPEVVPTNCTQRIFSATSVACTSNVFFDLRGLPSCFNLHYPFSAPYYATSIIFTPVFGNEFVCDIGQGIVYSGNLTATIYDSTSTRHELRTWPITVDTSGMEHCIGAGTSEVFRSCYVSVDPPVPSAYRPTNCNRTVLGIVSVVGEACGDFQFDVSYAFSGSQSCAALQFVDGVLFFEVSSSKSCDIGGGQQHTGTLAVYNSFYSGAWAAWTIKLLTGGVQHCVNEWGLSTTSTSASTSP